MVIFTWCWYVFGIAVDAIGGRYDSQTLCNALVLPHLATCIVHEAGTTVVMGGLRPTSYRKEHPSRGRGVRKVIANYEVSFR